MARDRYDEIGRSYVTTRREDPRIAAQVLACLGPARSVVNVGAGAGSYEPADRDVVAVEPSVQMLRQRAGRPAATIRGVAEALPFPDASFDVAMAILTVHHWSDPVRGLAELRRVAPRQIVFFYEPMRTHEFWALDYFPEALDLPTERNPPGEALLREHLRVTDIQTVPVPADCVDGFGAAFWSRPEAYLEPEVQAGMSWLALLPDAVRQRGADRLAADLESGAWDRRHGHLRHHETYDGGYRIAVAGTPATE